MTTESNNDVVFFGKDADWFNFRKNHLDGTVDITFDPPHYPCILHANNQTNTINFYGLEMLREIKVPC